VTSISLMLGACGVVGLAAAAVVAPPAASWRGAAEHSRAFWLVWIAGFAGLGFAAPATTGLGWGPAVWLAGWSAVAALQPSMVEDLVEVHRVDGRRASARACGSPSRPPAIRWQASAPGDGSGPARPVGPVTT
jgi:energy-converting hydrogenase Eha subunit G